MVCRIDVKDPFRQIPVDSPYTGKFVYVLDEYAVVDLLLQFGWPSSPCYRDLVASSLEYARNQTVYKMR